MKIDYANNGRRSLRELNIRCTAHLQPFFGERRAAVINYALVNKYVNARLAEGASNSSINRELAILKRAYAIGLRSGKVNRAPQFPRLEENNVRTGFIDDSQYELLAVECANEGLWLRALLAVAFDFGWRRGELLNLRVQQVDLLNRRVRLETGSTKNREGRTGVMTEEIYRLLSACVAGKSPLCYVFTHDDGTRIGDFRKRWAKVCRAVGLPGLHLHDLRRSMARKQRRMGVSEGTIMKLGGWRTASMFRRYSIVDESDLERTAKLIDQQRLQDRYKTPEIGANPNPPKTLTN